MPQPGHCYEVAYRFMMDHPKEKNAILVHGKVRNVMRGKKKFIDHAWVEIGDQVWDNAFFDVMFPKDAYYRISDARPERKYNLLQACKVSVKHGTYGKWHK